MIYTFDNTLDGLLTAVFKVFERKDKEVKLIPKKLFEVNLFEEVIDIITETEKSQRVWKKIEEIIPKSWRRKIYCAWLSEDADAHQAIFNTLIKVFSKGGNYISNYGDVDIITVSQWWKSVEREKHRMEAFIRFEKSQDGLFFCTIEPDFNVIPLIIKFFKNRFADQEWLIYDSRRNYGVLYDLKKVDEVILSKEEISKNTNLPSQAFHDPNEIKYQTLWKDYFKSTNIVARKNMKLHIRHVPKRYWRFLTEKQ